MSWLRRLERAFEPFAIPNLSLWLVAGQIILYLTVFVLQRAHLESFDLVPVLVLRGEVWRIFTYIFLPVSSSIYFGAFALYFFYFLGSTLEEQWGKVRFNLFIFLGFILTLATSFLRPGESTTNIFVLGSVFLAFAYLYPDFVMYIFFILPVKIKWLALFAWLGYGLAFVRGDGSVKLSILAALGNFFIFFAKDIWLDLKSGRRRLATQAKKQSDAADREPRHRCYVCGKDSNTNPEMDFRYCSKCAGDQCYCPEHIQNHIHVLSDEPPKS